jgi:cephalosporin hydroxylase
MRRRLGRLRRSLTRRISVFIHPPRLRVGGYRPPAWSRPLTDEERNTTDAFHRASYGAYLDGQGSMDLSWFGFKSMKTPNDLWIYQEIIAETKPEVIVESGTAAGGSSYFLASLFDLMGRGEVITIDITPRPNQPVHDRIRRLVGSSTAPEIVAEVRRRVGKRRTMVILDSDHSQAHVAAELEAYAGLVGPGCYIVVEDTNVNGHPVLPDHGPGPMEAVDAFLASRSDYEIDATRERLMLTINPRGYLRRIG